MTSKHKMLGNLPCMFVSLKILNMLTKWLQEMCSVAKHTVHTVVNEENIYEMLQ